MEIENILLLFSGACFSLAIIGALCELAGYLKSKYKPASWVKNVPYTVLVKEIIGFTGGILYNNKIKHFPEPELRYYTHKKYLGCFSSKVIIYIPGNKDIPTLVDTVLHEVKHYMQSETDKQYKRYDEFTGKYGYWDNPFEVECREFSGKHRDSCLKYLESKNLIRKILS